MASTVSDPRSNEDGKLAAASEMMTNERLSDILRISSFHPTSVTSMNLRILAYALLWERKRVAELEERLRNKADLEARGMP